MSQFSMTPTEVKNGVIECMQAGLVPFVTGSPGVGKSAIMKQIAEEYNLFLIDIRLSTYAPEDLTGLPHFIDKDGIKKASHVPFDQFPTENDPIPEGYSGWLAFLDEANSASKSIQAASYKLILDRMSGQYNLHENVFIVAAGNLATDRAIVTQMGTAMQSRLIHMELQISNSEFMANAVKEDYDYRVRGFLDFQPGKLHQFDPNHNDKTFACPRTWEFASRLCKGKAFKDINLKLLTGTLSQGVAIEFYTFMKEFGNLPKYSEIVGSPTTLPVPEKTSTRYAILTMLLDKFNKADFPDVVKYARRFPAEIQAVYFRGILQRDPKMRKNPDYLSNIDHLTDFLNNDDVDLAA